MQPFPGLPVGIYLAHRPIGTTCLALTLPRDEDGLLLPHPEDLRAQWWDVGASGDCTTATSSVVSTSVELLEPDALAIAIPLIPDGERRVVVRIIRRMDGGFTAIATTADERAEITFNFVERVDPVLAPVGG